MKSVKVQYSFNLVKQAIQNDNCALVKSLITQFPFFYQCAALGHAVMLERNEIRDMLISSGVSYFAALQAAAKKGTENAIIAISKKCTQKELDDAFILALYKGTDLSCKTLIEMGANVHIALNDDLQPDYAFFSFDDYFPFITNETPLIVALRRKFYGAAQLMIQKGCKVDFLKDADHCFLYSMLIKCDRSTLNTLTNNNETFKRISKKTFIEWANVAIQEGHEVLFEFLIDFFDINEKDPYGDTVLHIACANKSFKAFTLILDKNPDLLQVNDRKHSVFHKLFDSGSDLCTSVLDDDFKNVSNSKVCPFKNPKQNTPLEELIIEFKNKYNSTFNEKNDVKELKLKMLKMLLEKPHDINQKNYINESILLLAILKDSPREFVETILKDGANVNIQDGNGNTPLHFAKKHEQFVLLLNYGGDANAINDDGFTVLNKIIDKDCSETIDIFFKKSPSPPIDSKSVQIYFQKSLKMKNPSLRLVEYLISQGADVYFKDSCGRTALHYAYHSQSRALMDYFDKIIDKDIVDNNGLKASDYLEDFIKQTLIT